MRCVERECRKCSAYIEHMVGALPVTAAVMYRLHVHYRIRFPSFSFFDIASYRHAFAGVLPSFRFSVSYLCIVVFTNFLCFIS